MSILNHPPNPHIPYEHSEYGKQLMEHIGSKQVADQIQALRMETESRYREDQMRASWKQPQEVEDHSKRRIVDTALYDHEGELIANAKSLRKQTHNHQTHDSNTSDAVGTFFAFLFLSWFFYLLFQFLERTLT